jgi:hypothetical protein
MPRRKETTLARLQALPIDTNDRRTEAAVVIRRAANELAQKINLRVKRRRVKRRGLTIRFCADRGRESELDTLMRIVDMLHRLHAIRLLHGEVKAVWEARDRFQGEELSATREELSAERKARLAAEQRAIDALDMMLAERQKTATAGGSPPDSVVGTPNEAAQYVTLDQAAAIVQRSKRTLRRKKDAQGSTMPRPDAEGGGGKPDEWIWSKLRPWLENEFGKKLPEKHPSGARR